MKRNFMIGQSNEIIYKGKVFDLHNEYDLENLRFGPDHVALLSFEPNSQHGKEGLSLVLNFNLVDFIELSQIFSSHRNRDLDEIGFIGAKQRDDSWLLDEDQATSADHLFFRLGSGFVRIHAQEAFLRVTPVGR